MRLEGLDGRRAPVALLLHGQPGRGIHWAPVVEVLRDRMRVLAPDRPGYGGGDGRAGGFFDNAEAAVELLDRFDIESAVVAGHSWGGAAALAMASRFPERVGALVLVGCLVPRAEPKLVDRFFASRLIGRPATRLAFLVGGIALSLSFVRRLADSIAPAFAPEEIRVIGAEWRGDEVWQAVYLEQRAVVEELPLLFSELTSISVPVTILAGRHDLVSPRRQVRRLAEALPDSRLVNLGGGHMLPQQNPLVVADAIAAAAGSSR